MQPEHRGQIPSCVAPGRQQCSLTYSAEFFLHPLTVRPVGFEGDGFIHRESCLRLKFSIYNARPSKVLTTERLVDRFQGRLRDRERARQRYCFCSKKQTGTTPGRRKSSRQRGLVFFRDNYEIESGQGNDTTSVPRGRQTERQAVESPHDREARRSFSGTITRSRAGKATILLLVDRQNARPSKVLTTERLVFFRDH